jgi:L-histidine Nalpha-methyltransferase
VSPGPSAVGDTTADRAVLEAAGVEVHASAEAWTALASDVLQGLLEMPKTLPPKWFYDERGSELFDRITELAEYYPTRRERALLESVGAAIVEGSGAAEVVELGSGSSSKTPLLLDSMASAGALDRYVAVDVSAAAIESAARFLTRRYPGLRFVGEIRDFTRDLDFLAEPGPERRLVAFLGSTIGNLQPVEVRAFLGRLRDVMRPGDSLLLGTDLVKDPRVLEAAYDDGEGVTAEFNLNVLAVLNRELEADFDLGRFRHEAVYNATLDRIEMRLRTAEAHIVRIRALGIEVPFAAGESILTEISRKFTRESVERAYAESGFGLRRWCEDADGCYALSVAEPVYGDHAGVPAP